MVKEVPYNSPINENIRKKIREITDDKNMILFCERMLEKEILWQDNDEFDFKSNMKKWIDELFPYQESEMNE